MLERALRDQRFRLDRQILAKLGSRVHRVAEKIDVANQQDPPVVDADGQVDLFGQAEFVVMPEELFIDIEARTDGVVGILEERIAIIGVTF